MFGRRHAKTRQDLVRAEFGESLEHFRQAAAHAAGGVGASVGPRMGSAKQKVSNARGFIGPTAAKARSAAGTGWDSAIGVFVPLADAAREGAAKASKLPHRKDVPSHWYSRFGNGNGNDEESSSGHLSGTIMGLLAAGAAIGATGALVARRRNRTRWADYEPGAVKSDATQLIDTTKQPSADHPDVAHKVATWAKEHVDQIRHKIHEATADPEDMASTAKSVTHDIKDGAAHLQDKAEARLNDASARRATTSRPADSEVDDLLRSTHNGRM